MQDLANLTFLFTDIEGSTSKWEEQPEQMAQAVGRHDALLRDAVQGHGGHRSNDRHTVAALEMPMPSNSVAIRTLRAISSRLPFVIGTSTVDHGC